MNYIYEEINRIDWYPEENEVEFIKENLPLHKQSRLNKFNTINFFKHLGENTRVEHETEGLSGGRYTEFDSSYCVLGPGGSGKTNLMITYAKAQNIRMNFGSKIKSIDDIDFSEAIIVIDALNEIKNSTIIEEILERCLNAGKVLVCSMRSDLGIEYEKMGFKKVVNFKSKINWSRITSRKKKYQALFIKQLTPNIRDIKLFCHILDEGIGKNKQENNFFMDVRNTVEQYFVDKGARHIWNKLKEVGGSSKLTKEELDNLSNLGFPSQRFNEKVIIDDSFFNNLIIDPIQYIRGESKYHKYSSYIDWAKTKDRNIDMIKDVQSAMLCNVHNNETDFECVTKYRFITHDILPFLRGGIDLIKNKFFKDLLVNLKNSWKYEKIIYQPAFKFDVEKDNKIGNLLTYLSNNFGNRYVFGSIIYKLDFSDLFRYAADENDFYLFSAISYLIRYKSIDSGEWSKIKIGNSSFKETFSYISSSNQYFRNQPRIGLMSNLTEVYSREEPYERIVPDSFSNETISVIDHSLFHYSEFIGGKSFERDIFYKWLAIKFPDVSHSLNQSDSVPTQTPYKCGLNDEELLIMDTFQYEYSIECDFKRSNKHLRFVGQYTEWSSNAISATSNRCSPIFLENKKGVIENFIQAWNRLQEIIESKDIIFYESGMIDNFNCFADVSFTLDDTSVFYEDYEYRAYEKRKYSERKAGHELEQHADKPDSLWTGNSYNMDNVEYFSSPFCNFVSSKDKDKLSFNNARIWFMDGAFYFALTIDRKNKVCIDIESSEKDRVVNNDVKLKNVIDIFTEYYGKSLKKY